MAQTVKIILEDDLDGGPADETVRFGLDGSQYEIDLSNDNADKLRKALADYVASARRDSTRKSRTASPSAKKSDTAKIRKWAQENGHAVADRGRIHQHIRDAYYAAHKAA